jgi:hypothetical protein
MTKTTDKPETDQEQINRLLGERHALALWMREAASVLEHLQRDEHFDADRRLPIGSEGLYFLGITGNRMLHQVLVSASDLLSPDADKFANRTRLVHWEPTDQPGVEVRPIGKETVLIQVFDGHDCEVTGGYFEDGRWHDCTGMPVDNVAAWAHMPDGMGFPNQPVCNINTPWEAPTERG